MSQQKPEKEIELRNEEVTEILSAVPRWILRWGITMIFLLIVGTLLLSYFVKYPDSLHAKATVTSLNPPVSLVARSSGKITRLLVRNDQVVDAGAVLAVIENTADFRDVLRLSDLIDTVAYSLIKGDSAIVYSFKEDLHLGDLTSNYLRLLKAYNDYLIFTTTNPQQKEILLLTKQLYEYQNLLAKYEHQQSIYGEEFLLVKKDYARDSGLFSGGVIPAREYELKKKEYLAAQRNLETQQISLSSTRIAMSNIEKNKLDLQIHYIEQLNQFKTELTQAIKSIRSSIETWKHNYVFISPVRGRVSFFNYWVVNQNVKEGEDIFSVVPDHKPQLVARLLLPLENSGKVHEEQTVYIKIDNFPYLEHGMLKGKISSISPVPDKNNYVVVAELPEGLRTTYNQVLEYKEGISGTAEIITANRSVLDRIINKLGAMFSKD